MEELYAEGLATRGGPQPCVDDPGGRGEAQSWAGAGRAIEPRNHRSGVIALPGKVEGSTAGGARREPSGGPARSGNQGMCGTFMRENREIPCLARPADSPGGLSRERRGGNPGMNEDGNPVAS